MPNPTATCAQCARLIDLTDARLTVTPTIDAGYTFCPDCGEIVILSADATRRARAARGESSGPRSAPD